MNHWLRKIDEFIDFHFIYDKVEHSYCRDNGRTPLDPGLTAKRPDHSTISRNRFAGTGIYQEIFDAVFLQAAKR